MKNYYEVLRVSSSATEEEIHKAYEKMVSDFNSGKLLEKVDDVEEAYWVLSDPKMRLQYDHFFKNSSGLLKNFDGLDFSKTARKNDLEFDFAEDGEGGFLDLDDPAVAEKLFEKIKAVLADIKKLPLDPESLANILGSKRGTPNNDVNFDLKISSREALVGGYKAVDYTCYVKCSDCGGLGSKNSVDLAPCVVCADRPVSEIERAFGKQEQVSRVTADNIGLVQPHFWNKRGAGLGSFKKGNVGIGTKCLVCAGLGKYPKKNCPKCKGQGRVMATRKAEILVPPRVKNNTLLKVANQGNFGFRGTTGSDLIVKIKITK